MIRIVSMQGGKVQLWLSTLTCIRPGILNVNDQKIDREPFFRFFLLSPPGCVRVLGFGLNRGENEGCETRGVHGFGQWLLRVSFVSGGTLAC